MTIYPNQPGSTRKSFHTMNIKPQNFLIDRGRSRTADFELTASAVLNLSTIGQIYGYFREIREL